MPDHPPPSKPELDALIRERKKDLQRPAPVPTPGGTIREQVNRPMSEEKQQQAQQREERIRAVSERLAQAKGRAERDFRRSR